MNIDHIGRTLFFISLAFLIFLGGVYVAISKIYPYTPLEQAYRAGVALYRQRTEYGTPFQTDLWHKARTDARGVTIYDPARAENGYTLFTAGDGPYAWLIDMQGHVVHEWRRPYSTVHDQRSPIDNPRPDRFIYMRKARVFPNGDLLAIYIGSGDTPWGYGLAKIDRDSNLIWKYPGRAHHDFSIAPDGRIFALTHEFQHPPDPLGFLQNPYLEDSLVVLSADGKELKKFSMVQALYHSRFAGLLFTAPHYAAADPLHTNAVAYLDRKEAAAIPNAEAGDLLVSFRSLSVLAVLDPESEKIVWATRGDWLGQHDPDVLDNGDILLFDNNGRFEPGNTSRVLELNPRTHAIVWQYQGSDSAPLDSTIRSAVQRLDNGNTLITESNGGRLFEVTPEGEIVWEYVHPVRGGDDGQYIPAVSWGRRIRPEQLASAFRQTLARR